MNRRHFIATTAVTAAGGALVPLFAARVTPSPPAATLLVRFGIVADPHFARRGTAGGARHYAHSVEKMREAIRVFNARELDFVVELGDFKDADAVPDRIKSLAYLDEIEAVLQTFGGPVYHVLGNHDQDCISKKDFLGRTRNAGAAAGKTFYSFTAGGVKFVVLDANFRPDGVAYDCGNFSWEKAFVPPAQLRWLADELRGAPPVVVFAHQRLDVFPMRSAFDRALVVSNAAAVRRVLEDGGNVLAVFQGHDHRGGHTFRNGIHYHTQRGMIEGAYPQNNSFSIAEVFADGSIAITGFRNAASRSLRRAAPSSSSR